jgi:hypothetical protein
VELVLIVLSFLHQQFLLQFQHLFKPIGQLMLGQQVDLELAVLLADLHYHMDGIPDQLEQITLEWEVNLDCQGRQEVVLLHILHTLVEMVL